MLQNSCLKNVVLAAVFFSIYNFEIIICIYLEMMLCEKSLISVWIISPSGLKKQSGIIIMSRNRNWFTSLFKCLIVATISNQQVIGQ